MEPFARAVRKSSGLNIGAKRSLRERRCRRSFHAISKRIFLTLMVQFGHGRSERDQRRKCLNESGENRLRLRNSRRRGYGIW